MDKKARAAEARSVAVRLRKPASATSEPISHQQQSTNKPNIWEVTAAPAVPESPLLTVTQSAAEGEGGTPALDAPKKDGAAEGTKAMLKGVTTPAPTDAAGAPPLDSPGATMDTAASLLVGAPPGGDGPAAATDAVTPATNRAASGADSRPLSPKKDAASPRKRHGAAGAADGPIETLTYRDPFAGVYKKSDIHYTSLHGDFDS